MHVELALKIAVSVQTRASLELLVRTAGWSPVLAQTDGVAESYWAAVKEFGNKKQWLACLVKHAAGQTAVVDVCQSFAGDAGDCVEIASFVPVPLPLLAGCAYLLPMITPSWLLPLLLGPVHCCALFQLRNRTSKTALHGT